VVLVDECVETGITTLAAIKSMLEHSAMNVYIAVPILDAAVRDNLIQVSDGVYCPHTIQDYISIEYYYKDLEKPTFETIERILEAHE
jgi:putative phosphoribosyl transferase